MTANVTASRNNGARQRPRGYADWSPRAKTQVILDQVLCILDEYAHYLPLTVRQIFYRLVGAYDYPKDEKAYARLAEALVRARRARLIPFDHIRDDGITEIRDRWYGGMPDFWDAVARSARDYKRNKQAGQAHYVELWCEAQGMMPQLARIADAYSVPVYSSGGFVSLSAVRFIVDRICKHNVPTVLLHVGDYDPSGESIFDSMTRDADAFLREDSMLPGIHRLIAERVALTGDQVAQHALPTAPPKAKDSRSARWVGETCQLEALAPDQLADLVRAALERHFNTSLLGAHRQLEREERTALLRALPSGEEEAQR